MLDCIVEEGAEDDDGDGFNPKSALVAEAATEVRRFVASMIVFVAVCLVVAVEVVALAGDGACVGAAGVALRMLLNAVTR